MITHTFDYRNGSGVTYTETFACHTVDECFTGGCTVQCHVTDDNVILCLEPAALGRIYHQLTTGQALAKVIVAVTYQLQGKTLGDKGSEGLSACTLTQYMVGILFHVISQFSGDLTSEDRTEGTVGVADIHFDAALLSRIDGFAQLL